MVDTSMGKRSTKNIRAKNRENGEGRNVRESGERRERDKETEGEGEQ